MFELIKKWFKRPIVINFTVEPVSSDMVIGVIKTDSCIGGEVRNAVRNAWMETFPAKKCVVIPSGISLEQLSDEDLRAIGLIRYGVLEYPGPSTIPQEGTWLLDKGEHVVATKANSGIAKYLRKDKYDETTTTSTKTSSG